MGKGKAKVKVAKVKKPNTSKDANQLVEAADHIAINPDVRTRPACPTCHSVDCAIKGVSLERHLGIQRALCRTRTIVGTSDGRIRKLLIVINGQVVRGPDSDDDDDYDDDLDYAIEPHNANGFPSSYVYTAAPDALNFGRSPAPVSRVRLGECFGPGALQKTLSTSTPPAAAPNTPPISPPLIRPAQEQLSAAYLQQPEAWSRLVDPVLPLLHRDRDTARDTLDSAVHNFARGFGVDTSWAADLFTALVDHCVCLDNDNNSAPPPPPSPSPSPPSPSPSRLSSDVDDDDPSTERHWVAADLLAFQTMPQDESKPVDPAKEEAETPAADKGKQPAVESESEDDDAADAEPAQGGEGSAGADGAAKKKKKKSKRKKLKDALTGKSSDPDADKKEAIDKLTPKQIQEFMAFNPALAQEVSKQAGGESSASFDPARAAEMLKKLKLEDVMTGLASTGKNVKDMASYKFWQTQPVPRFDEASSKPVEDGPIKVQSIDEIPKEPAPLGIDGFEWVTVDIEDPAQIKEVYELLNGHFVEDNEAMFRFNYGTSTLKWAMMPPGWKKEWHVGIRTTTSKRLVAFISAIPVELRLRDKILHSSEVNFMVVHKKLRSKRLAPVLIKEITRLCNLQGVWQAIYTAGVVLPKPVSTARYYHRALNWQKLYEVGFSPLPPNSKPQYQIRKYHLPEQTAIKGLREMKKEDVPAALSLLKRYLKRYDMTPEWTEEEAVHWLLPKVEEGDEQFVWSFVVEDENKKITDFVSFYSLESTVINNPRHSVIRAAYLYYYATEVGLTTPVDRKALKTRLNALVHDQLILAKRYKFDVFNALSLMDNGLFLEEQKFGGGDGQLHYYLFNYRTNPIAGGINRRNQLDEDGLSGIGFVML